LPKKSQSASSVNSMEGGGNKKQGGRRKNWGVGRESRKQRKTCQKAGAGKEKGETERKEKKHTTHAAFTHSV